MAKKAKNCPAWLATFADLMSLLMAIFVLLYSMSTIEEPKYVEVVKSLSESLGGSDAITKEQVAYFAAVAESIEAEKAKDAPPIEVVSQIEELKPLYESLVETFAQSDGTSDIQIEYDPEADQIKVIFPEQIAFDPGRAQLKPRFAAILSDSYDLSNESVSLKVIGHTDKRPVTGGRFHSNWELSSARASSVVEFLVRNGRVRAEQAQAIGVADTQPISKGESYLDFAKNRRVEVLISTDKRF
ncbi:MAG: flagellar motor protein MotB [Gammaproteobacteria bacterium]|nr:flagellar motor protein MotB [Gammaproteobacteria bacterium]